MKRIILQELLMILLTLAVIFALFVGLAVTINAVFKHYGFPTGVKNCEYVYADKGQSIDQ